MTELLSRKRLLDKEIEAMSEADLTTLERDMSALVEKEFRSGQWKTDRVGYERREKQLDAIRTELTHRSDVKEMTQELIRHLTKTK